MLAENFGIDWLKVELPFQAEVHWLRPRAKPLPNRYSVLVAHTEPDQFTLNDAELMAAAANFDLVVVKENRLNIPNAIEDCFGSTWIEETPKRKDFSVSYLFSAGNHQGLLDGYSLRLEVYLSRSRLKGLRCEFFKSGYLEKHGLKIPGFPGSIDLPLLRDDRKDCLFESMFHICIENSREKNYFTEKIVDAFRTYTVPIYNGCTNINEHFDARGIISFNTSEELVEMINNLTPDDYFKRMPYLAGNYENAESYFNIWDRLAKKIVHFRNRSIFNGGHLS